VRDTLLFVTQSIVKTPMSYGEYLAFDESSAEKHEFWNGEIFAMSGGSLAHARIAANLIYRVSAQLEGTPCSVYTSDARIRAEASKNAAYPDVSVICGTPETHEGDPHTAKNPKVLIEVLSDSTEAFDRGAKFADYRQIASLRSYLLVSQRDQRIEIYERNSPAEAWVFRVVEDGSFVIESVGALLRVSDVYRGVER
jgi:Uma2 family endonuclease